ncbi:hypothetical protein J1605_002324 [Eschrichtius robustus]|uniref:Uncharacterized protein n=1 Tax=Eschrichtius robustus TaxID=9764 RepID=A0AB34HWX0_ESCRO|nr:hypothetical protein J1605_002324 [Eschrichtius robustus]
MRCGTASVLPVFLPQSSGFGLADCSPAAWPAFRGAGHRLPSSLPQAQVRRGPWGSGGSAGWPPGLPHAWPKGLAGWILSWSRDRPRLSQPAVTLSACLTGVPLLEERLDFEDRSLGWLGSTPLGGLDVLTSSLPSSLASLVVFWFNLSSDSGSPERFAFRLRSEASEPSRQRGPGALRLRGKARAVAPGAESCLDARP